MNLIKQIACGLLIFLSFNCAPILANGRFNGGFGSPTVNNALDATFGPSNSDPRVIGLTVVGAALAILGGYSAYSWLTGTKPAQARPKQSTFSKFFSGLGSVVRGVLKTGFVVATVGGGLALTLNASNFVQKMAQDSLR